MATRLREELNRVNYSASDFDTHIDDLLGQLQVQFAAEFNDFVLSSLGIVLLDLVAYGLDALSFYLDRRSSDNFLETARTRSSVSRLARQLGYSPRGAVPSSTDLRVFINTPIPLVTPLNAGTQFNGPNGTIYESVADVEFPAGVGPEFVLQIPVSEGQTIIDEFVSDGTANQVYSLASLPTGTAIVDNSVEVLVENAPWEARDFIEVGGLNQFETGLSDDPPTVRFGDGTAGNIPPAGQTIRVTYRASFGRSGQAGRSQITSLVSPVNVDGNLVDFTITNPESASGGDDQESIASIKRNAPSVRKSRDVAITREDYVALASAFSDPLFGRVAVAQAITTRDGTSDLRLQQLLSSIQASISINQSVLDAAVSSGQASVSAVSANLTADASSLEDLEAALLNISDQTDLIRTSLVSASRLLTGTNQPTASGGTDQGLITAASSASTSLQNISNRIGEVRTLLNNVAVDSSSQSDFDTALERLATASRLSIGIEQELSTVRSRASEVDAQVLSVLSSTDTIRDSLGAAGLDLGVTSTLIGSLSLNNTESANEVTSVSSQFDLIDGAQLALEGDVIAASASITEHVGRFLSNSCKSNVVTVPILTKDSGGFFVGPSTGLIRATQDYLDSRKEITQTVSVVSGSALLVRAVISVRVGVDTRNGFGLSETATEVQTLVEGVLRDRDFGESLFDSDFDLDSIQGVKYWNLTIDGIYDPDEGTVVSSRNTARLDNDGNLIVGTGDIVTRALVRDALGTPGIIVTPEVAIENR